MQTVITGAAGHIGGNLVRTLLARGNRPRVLVRSDQRALAGLDVDRVEGDVRDPESLTRAFAGAELVFHLAAHISLVDKDAEETHEINTRGAANVAAACLATKVKRLIHFSSVHALSALPVDAPVDETRSLITDERVSHYDRSKAEAERQILTAVERGLDAVILNPTGVIGPHDYRPSAMGAWFVNLYQGRLPALVNGGFDFVDVRDVVAGALAAVEKGRRGERYLLSGHRAEVKALAALVEEVTGKRAPRLITPMWLARALAPFATAQANATGKPPRVTAASLYALRNHKEVRHDKATRELGYQPRPLKQTVADIFAWLQKDGVLAR